MVHLKQSEFEPSPPKNSILLCPPGVCVYVRIGDLRRGKNVTVGFLSVPSTANGNVYGGIHHGHGKFLADVQDVVRGGNRSGKLDRLVALEELERTDESLRTARHRCGETSAISPRVWLKCIPQA